MSQQRNKIFFASDFHLGAAAIDGSIEREKKIVEWLHLVGPQASEIFLVGDIFDYWFEYAEVIPKGYTRLLGTIAKYADAGVKFHFFTGNHDMWVFDYFTKELGMDIHYAPKVFERFGKKVFVGHGDGLGPGDRSYKMIKKVFNHPLSKWLFARIHPNLGMKIMRYTSKSSRLSDSEPDHVQSMDKEWLVIFAEAYLKNNSVDFFVFGHRHIPITHTLSNGKSVYFNLGEWWKSCTYLVMGVEEIGLKRFDEGEI